MNFELLFCALGLAILMEGVFYTLFAKKLPGMFMFMAGQDSSVLRKGGVIAMILGVVVIALVRLG